MVLELSVCAVILLLTTGDVLAQDADTMCRRLVSGECDGGWRYSCEERSCAAEARHLVCSCSCQFTVSDYVPCTDSPAEQCDSDTLRFFVGSRGEYGAPHYQAFQLDASSRRAQELPLSTQGMIYTASDISMGLVFFATERLSGVGVYDVASKQDHVIASGLPSGLTLGIGLDTLRQFVFVSNDANGIYSMNYEGENFKFLVEPAASIASNGITTDPDNSILYFTNRDENKVEMVDYTDLDAPGPRIVLIDGLPDSPRGIWLDKEAQMIYFILTNGHIYEMPIADPSQTKSITGACSGCSARSLVKCGDTFYYSDVAGDSIWKVTPSEGNDRVKVNMDSVGVQPFGLSRMP